MYDGLRKIEDLTKGGEWASIKAKVIQLWGPRSESISQVGLLGDETSQIKFVAWKKSNLPLLEKGKNYIIQGGIIDSWNGKFQINLNRRTKVSYTEEKIEIKSDELDGRIVKIIPKSGYIERCPKCSRVLVNDHCVVHVEVEPVEDIRIKISLGNNSKVVVVNGELAEQMLNLNLKYAKIMDEKELDCIIEAKLIGKKYRFKGKEFEENFIAKDFEEFGD